MAVFIKHYKNILILAVVLGCIIGCSEDKSPTTNGDTYSFKITYGGISKDVNLADYPWLTIDGEEAVRLADLVDTTEVIHPLNYGYRIIGQDGFYAHVTGIDDNTWEHIQSGYIILSSMLVNFDPSLGLINRYNIKNAAEINILRKIGIITPADSLIQYIVEELPEVTFQDTLAGIELTELLPAGIVDNPSDYMFDLIADDGCTKTIGYQQFQSAFYITSLDRVLYSDETILNMYKIKYLNRVLMFNPMD